LFETPCFFQISQQAELGLKIQFVKLQHLDLKDIAALYFSGCSIDYDEQLKIHI